MKIYYYDYITFEYTHDGETQPNPIDPDYPLMPPCATPIEPLLPQEGFTVVWNKNNWIYAEDHRGEIWYNAQLKKLVTIDFIGELPNYYFTPDSPIANPPEGSYWEFDIETQTWVANVTLYKIEVYNMFSTIWEYKNNVPYTFNGHRYVAKWRDLYNSIYSTLKDGIKEQYRLQDYDGYLFYVNEAQMKEIYVKMANVVDEMYTDKQDLEVYFKDDTHNDYEDLSQRLQAYLRKTY